MGKLRVIKAGMMATVQDTGRFGFRQYGIPQSGAMDISMMNEVNYLVGNAGEYPVIEFALVGMKLVAVEESIIGVMGAMAKVNGAHIEGVSCLLSKGDVLEMEKPFGVYGYLGIGGILNAKKDFGSCSTYILAGFGGIEGRALEVGDVLVTRDESVFEKRTIEQQKLASNATTISILKGPEWAMLKESSEGKVFTIDPSSNRMGVRLAGAKLKCDGAEIISSAVIPGTIQLPPNGEPIILMKDCGTTGGYPRIGKVLEEDMGKLAQVAHKKTIQLVASS